MKNKRGQMEVTFNWVYVLIAGAVILLFFFGIVIKGKATAEERLEKEVVEVLESILVAAGVSEKTKQTVEMSGLGDYIFEFKCEGGLGTFGIREGAREEIPREPVFGPREIKTTRLILWSLPYHLPYKVMDLLILSSINTKYFIIGEGGGFGEELERALSFKGGDKAKFNYEPVESLEAVEPGGNFQVRIIDLDGTNIISVPEGLKGLEDRRVSAVSFSGSKASYYQKEGEVWKLLDRTEIISLGREKEAAKYAAIFAADGGSYECNMMKVFQRLEHVNEVYGRKLGEIKKYYEGSEGSCSVLAEKAEAVFRLFKSKGEACAGLGEYKECDLWGLEEQAKELRRLNSEDPGHFDLEGEGCLKLY